MAKKHELKSEHHKEMHVHEEHEHEFKLNPKKMGLTFGIFYALNLLVLSLMSYMLNWGFAIVRMLGSMYPGYGVSLSGAFFGVLWGFLDGFIGGYIFAWIFNKISKCKF